MKGCSVKVSSNTQHVEIFTNIHVYTCTTVKLLAFIIFPLYNLLCLSLIYEMISNKVNSYTEICCILTSVD